MEKKRESISIRRKETRINALVFAKGDVLKKEYNEWVPVVKLDANTMVWDISPGGLFITSDSELPMNAIINLSFCLPGYQKPISLRGKVIRRTLSKVMMGGKYGFAIVTTDISDGDKAVINEFVKEMELMGRRPKARRR